MDDRVALLVVALGALMAGFALIRPSWRDMLAAGPGERALPPEPEPERTAGVAHLGDLVSYGLLVPIVVYITLWAKNLRQMPVEGVWTGGVVAILGALLPLLVRRYPRQ